MNSVITIVRTAVNDCTEPYNFTDDYIMNAISLAVNEYSKYNPVKKRGALKLQIGVKQYALPDDFVIWIDLPDDYEVVGKSVFLNQSPVMQSNISYTYYANRSLDEIPVYDIPLIVDHCFCTIISGFIKEQSDISSIKLGQGLQIQFSSISELEKLAHTKQKNFHEKMGRIFGGWS